MHDLSNIHFCHDNDVIMSILASQIASLTIVYSTVYSGADQTKYLSSASLACAGNSPVTGEFPAQRASNAENVSIRWRHHVKHHHFFPDHTAILAICSFFATVAAVSSYSVPPFYCVESVGSLFAPAHWYPRLVAAEAGDKTSGRVHWSPVAALAR